MENDESQISKFAKTKLFVKVGVFLKNYERLLLAALSVVILITGAIWFKQFTALQEKTKTTGGTYVEGIVGNEFDLAQEALNLTNSGIFLVSETGELENHLVTSWTKNSDSTEYKLYLKDGVDAEEIRSIIELNTDIFSLPVITVNGQELIIALNEPNPSLPLLLTRPLFPYGAYRVTSNTGKTIVLSRTGNGLSAPAFLNKIVLHAYDQQSDLINAVARKKVNGAVVPRQDTYADNWQEIDTQRYFAVVFNINQSPFRDSGNRLKLINNEPAKLTFTATALNSEPYKIFAEELADQWRKLGSTVEVKLLSSEELTSTTTNRKFQAMVVGLDYGLELDPYFIWHSTQVRASDSNLTGIKNTEVDAMIAAVRDTLNISKRFMLIDQLHIKLQELGVVKIIGREEDGFYLDTAVQFVSSGVSTGVKDRWLTLHQWSY